MSLPRHPGVEEIRLPNGLVAWIRPTGRAGGGIAAALHVGVGALHESDEEQGLGHMVEHLVFAGSERFGPGDLERLFDSWGTALGRHHNATTGREWTVYTLTFPQSAALGNAVEVLADFAARPTFPDAAVERERRVILEEIRHHDRSDVRVRRRILEALAPGSRLASRHPLGTAATVATFDAAALRTWHRLRYRPERSVLVVAGDLEVDAARNLVTEHFGPWRSGGPAPGEPDCPLAGSGPGEPFLVVEDPAVRDAEVRILRLRRAPPPGSEESWREATCARLAERLATERLQSLARSGQTAFRNASLGSSTLAAGLRLVQAAAVGSAGRAPRLVEELLREVRRELLHPVEPDAVERVRDDLVAGLRQAIARQGDRETGAALRELGRGVPAGRIPPSETQRLDLVERLLADVRPEELRDALGRRFEGSGTLAVVAPTGSPPVRTLRSDAPGGGLAGLAARLDAERPGPPERRRPTGRRTPSGLAAIDPAAVDEPARELGVLAATYPNGVRARVRAMDRRPGRVFVELTLAGGRIEETAADLGITGAAALPFAGLATARTDDDELRRRLLEDGFGFEVHVDEDVVTFRLSGPTDGLDTGLEVLRLLLAVPRLDDRAFRLWKRRLEARADPTAEERLAFEASRLLGGDDPRFRRLDPDRIRALELGAARAWLDRLRLGPVEVAVAGDLDRDRALAAVGRTLGHLEMRSTLHARPPDHPIRRLPDWNGPVRGDLATDPGSPEGRAALLCGWRTAPWHRTAARRRLQVGSAILGRRLHRELREVRGLTYSVEATFSPSRAYPLGSLLSIALIAEPGRLGEAEAAVESVIADLAAAGPTDPELAAARAGAAELADRVEREPKYWARVLAELDLRGLPPRELAGLGDRIRALGADEIRESVAESAAPANRLTVTCRPGPRAR